MSLLPEQSLCRIPFICKIRKVNCNLRPDTLCCQNVTTTSTTSPPSTPPSAVEGMIEHINEATGSEVVPAQPSQIDESYSENY